MIIIIAGSDIESLERVLKDGTSQHNRDLASKLAIAISEEDEFQKTQELLAKYKYVMIQKESGEIIYKKRGVPVVIMAEAEKLLEA